MKRSKFKVTHVGEIRRGTSKKDGNEWQAQDIVLEEVNEEAQYPENFVTSLKGENIAKGLRVGETMECTPFIRAREYQGRYYNEVSVKNIVPLRGQDVRPFGYEK